MKPVVRLLVPLLLCCAAISRPAAQMLKKDAPVRVGHYHLNVTSVSDHKRFWVDTLGGTISACEIGSSGELGPAELIVTIDPKDGYPDGPTIDSEGCIWISLYAGWEARRYSPAGELLARVSFPVANITKIAFGGPDLRTAYATTARQLLTQDQLDAQPLAGGLFEFEVDVPGVACPLIAD